MDLTTKYMGLTLRSPLVPAASPLSNDIDNIKRMEDAGASAVVLESLFEEQLTLEKFELHHHLSQGTESFAEARSFYPEPEEFRIGPEEYLKHIQQAKAAVKIPVIASLNGKSVGGWTDYAKQMQQAGADALELNIYYVETDMALPGSAVDQTYVDILRAVKSAVSIPVAVKLGSFFSNIGNMVKRLDETGADGLVLFNRFYQPDFDLETLEVTPHIILSTPFAMRLPLTWIAILHGRISADLAATSGIHYPEDVIKCMMAGAKIAELCSVLLRHGIGRIRDIEKGMVEWMQKHEYESIQQMQGSMSQINSESPAAYERAQYMRAITSYKPEAGQ
ncbi:MAG: dihydroorotate dehydrogenase-like protein [Verrucomicrobia bacterium]|nr:dihydroorotate dehydrogenase-like protein [Verrucomicrobiota bacterium]